MAKNHQAPNKNTTSKKGHLSFLPTESQRMRDVTYFFGIIKNMKRSIERFHIGGADLVYIYIW